MDVAQIGWVNHVNSCVYVLEYCCVFNLFVVHLIQQLVSEHVGGTGGVFWRKVELEEEGAYLLLLRGRDLKKVCVPSLLACEVGCGNLHNF